MHAALRVCGFGVVLVQRLLDYIQPDFVHVMIDGQIVQTGGKARSACKACSSLVRMCIRLRRRVSCDAVQELAAQLELSGYAEMGR